MKKSAKRRLCVALLLAGVFGAWACHRWAVSRSKMLIGLPAVRKHEAPVNSLAASIRFPQPTIVTLSDGLRVFVIEDHRLPYVQCSLALPAGSLMEMKRGQADMTAAMLQEGTDHYSETQLASAVEQRGMALTSQADLESTTIRLGGSASDFPKMLALMSDVLLHPTFPTTRLLRIQEVNAKNWKRTHSNSIYVTRKIASPLFYGNTPYGQPQATLAEADGLGRQDLINFYQRCYRPHGAVLGVIGDVNAVSARQQIVSAMASWKAEASSLGPPRPDFPTPPPHEIHIADWAGSSDTWLYFQTLTMGRSDPDYVPFVVANRVFGGASSSRLFQNLRETHGLTYGAYSDVTTTMWPSLWRAWTAAPYAETASSVQSVYGELQRLGDDPISTDELERAKRGLIGTLAVSLDDPKNVLDAELDLVKHGLPADYWQTYCRQVQAVTPQDVRRVAKRYLGDNVQVIVVGPRDKIIDGLRPLGTVIEYDDHGDMRH